MKYRQIDNRLIFNSLRNSNEKFDQPGLFSSPN